MTILSPTSHHRLNEVVGLLLLAAAVALGLSLESYNPLDPSWNTATAWPRPQNLLGYPGAYTADLTFQLLGLAAFLIPLLLLALGWKWIRSEEVEISKPIGAALLVSSACAALAVYPTAYLWKQTTEMGGLTGRILADDLLDVFNATGAVIAILIGATLSLYLLTTFSLARFGAWLGRRFAFAGRWRERWAGRWSAWREQRREAAALRAEEKRQARAAAAAARAAARAAEAGATPAARVTVEKAPAEQPAHDDAPPIVPLAPEQPPAREIAPEPAAARPARKAASAKAAAPTFTIPPTTLLDPPAGRNPYDEEELKHTAVLIRSKLEEFNVRGGVTQINPGPVVTTFEYKPEAGVKYSRITNLAEDLCLGLQAESILIERIPGKSTVGIEVPNKRREVISLREIIESPEFQDSTSHLTISLGKDINGRIRVTNLEAMPHLLIAGSTGSGKSVLMNCLIMSILYKATPDEVRFIMVDPKRLELGLYEEVPHLLTPVITDLKKASYALRNATLEMERRLKLLATQGVRNIDQYNRKIRSRAYKELTLFDQEEAEEPAEPLPYIVILIDELADLMLLEGNNVEESITRLAQMARAVGIHLVLATQRPSVDVITGLIKANFPARISFRVATRVDSRTILDSMGAEALLGRGDMLYSPPGSGRMIRVHGPYVSESEISSVVSFWKEQSEAVYENEYLAPPPKEEDRAAEEDADAEYAGAEDPMYEDAVRVVLEMGKASTSTLQRRLRLGYGRAARILDAMEKDGIIGPPDGPRPREVLKRPDWLAEVDNSLR
ncbi:MAG TPA: DNA translocase FtsK 4TM domain-containing protein [Bryobacterales bacterium]|nr:DNA translocase FtsK 4TM domain-containing protein [Bryobacterales bacterium]